MGLSPKLELKLARLVGRCVEDWQLIAEGDRILVGVSGGKDSLTLLHLLRRMQRIAPVKFELLAFHLNTDSPDFPTRPVVDWLERIGQPYVLEDLALMPILESKQHLGDNPCFLCSRLRRGILYTQAVKHGCHSIALGHHRDDTIETLLLNLFYAGQIKAMPAKLRSDDGRNTVIRPMLYVPEAMLREAAIALELPVVASGPCKLLKDGKRARVKALLDALEADNPKVRGNLLAALGSIVPSHLLLREIPALGAAASDEDR